MSYASPLSILSEQQIADFKPEHIKKIRSELLLQFQLSVEPTIIIDNVPYDKDEIISLLDQLQEDPELHFEIFNNKPLLHYLEEGKIEFFKDKDAQAKVLLHPTRAREIQSLVVDNINLLLPEWILPIGLETVGFLEDVSWFVRKLDTPLQELAYSETYTTINQIVSTLQVDYSDPFEEPGSNNFKPILEQVVTRDFVAYFKHLPKAFESLLRKYRVWCYGLTAAFVQKQLSMSRFNSGTLRTVMEAAIIAADHNDRETNLEIAANIDRYLSGDPVRKKSNSGWITVVFLIIGIIKIGALCNRQSHRNSYSSYRDNNNNYQTILKGIEEKNNHSLDRPSLVTNAQGSQQGKTTTQNKISPSKFNGSGFKNDLYYSLLDIKETKGRTILHYEAEIIPSRVDKFYEYVPAVVKKNHQGQQRDITLTFHRKGLPGVQFSHNLRMDFNKGQPVIGFSPVNVTGGKTIVKVVPRSNTNYKFKGYLTRLDSLGKILLQDTIEVFQRASGTSPYMAYNGTFIETGDNQSREDYRIEARMNCMLHNLDLFNNKILFSEVGNEIKDVWRYELKTKINQDQTTLPEVQLSGLKTESSALHFLFQSAKDNIAYFTILLGPSDFKYMFDTTTGLIKGLQVATCSKDGTIMERIELFSVE